MYRVIHDDADWPDDLDRTVSTHQDFGDAVSSLDDLLEARDVQLTANGEGGSGLALAVVDENGTSLVTASAAGPPLPPEYRTRWPDPSRPTWESLDDWP